jgi:hypothetical protein
MAALTAQDALAYLDRWKLVQDEQAAQQQRDSMVVKLQQLAALMASREIFGTDPDRDREVLQVRERWARVRQAFCG